jgi:hypothetical protein
MKQYKVIVTSIGANILVTASSKYHAIQLAYAKFCHIEDNLKHYVLK